MADEAQVQVLIIESKVVSGMLNYIDGLVP